MSADNQHVVIATDVPHQPLKFFSLVGAGFTELPTDDHILRVGREWPDFSLSDHRDRIRAQHNFARLPDQRRDK